MDFKKKLEEKANKLLSLGGDALDEAMSGLKKQEQPPADGTAKKVKQIDVRNASRDELVEFIRRQHTQIQNLSTKLKDAKRAQVAVAATTNEPNSESSPPLGPSPAPIGSVDDLDSSSNASIDVVHLTQRLQEAELEASQLRERVADLERKLNQQQKEESWQQPNQQDPFISVCILAVGDESQPNESSVAEEAERSLAEHQSIVSQLQCELEEYKSKLVQTTEEKNEWEVKCHQLSSQLEELHSQMDSTQTQFVALTEEKNEWAAKSAQLSSQLTELQTQLESAQVASQAAPQETETNSDSQRALSDALQEIESLKEQLSQHEYLSFQITERAETVAVEDDQKIAALTEENARLQAAIESLQRELEEAQKTSEVEHQQRASRLANLSTTQISSLSFVGGEEDNEKEEDEVSMRKSQLSTSETMALDIQGQQAQLSTSEPMAVVNIQGQEAVQLSASEPMAVIDIQGQEPAQLSTSEVVTVVDIQGQEQIPRPLSASDPTTAASIEGTVQQDDSNERDLEREQQQQVQNEEKVNELEKQLKEAQVELEKIRDELTQSLSALQESSTRESTLQNQLSDEHARVVALETEIASTQVRISELESSFTQQEQGMGSEVERLKERVKELESEIERAKEVGADQVKQARDEHEDFKKKTDLWKDKVKQITQREQQKMEAVRTQLKEAEERAEGLKAELARAMEVKAESASESEAKLIREIADLQGQLSQSSESASTAQNRANELERELSEKTAEMSELQKKLEEVQLRFSETTLECCEVKKKLEDAKNETNEIKKKVDDVQTRCLELSTELLNDRTQLQEKTLSLTALTAEKTQLEAKVGELEGKLREAESSVESSRVEFEKVKSRLDEVEEEYSRYKTRAHAALKQKVLEFTEKQKKLESETEKAKSDFTKISETLAEQETEMAALRTTADAIPTLQQSITDLSLQLDAAQREKTEIEMKMSFELNEWQKKSEEWNAEREHLVEQNAKEVAELNARSSSVSDDFRVELKSLKERSRKQMEEKDREIARLQKKLHDHRIQAASLSDLTQLAPPDSTGETPTSTETPKQLQPTELDQQTQQIVDSLPSIVSPGQPRRSGEGISPITPSPHGPGNVMATIEHTAPLTIPRNFSVDSSDNGSLSEISLSSASHFAHAAAAMNRAGSASVGAGGGGGGPRGSTDLFQFEGGGGGSGRNSRRESTIAGLSTTPTSSQREQGLSDLVRLANLQAQRDIELHKYREQLTELRSGVEDRDKTIELLVQQHETLKGEIRNLQRSQKRESGNLEYLKNIVVKFLEAKDAPVQDALLPVISTVLQFSPDECSRVLTNRSAKAFPKTNVFFSQKGMSR